MNIMIVEDDIALNHGIALAFSNSGDTFFLFYSPGGKGAVPGRAVSSDR